MEETLGRVRAAWSRLDPVNPFQAETLKHALQTPVTILAEISGVLGLIAGLAVMISSFGLLGIASYTVRTRRREVGIRKALGATTLGLAVRLTGEFAWLVGGTLVITVPLAWVVNQLWLSGFAYRIDLDAGVFLAVGAALLGLALGAVATQTVRVAQTNPAEVLRAE